MKKLLSLFLTLVFVFSLFACLSVSAYALTYTGTVGTAMDIIICGSQGDDDPVTNIFNITGLPPGLQLVVVNGWEIALQGTPTQAGTYTLSYHFSSTSAVDQYPSIPDTIVISPGPFAITKSPSSETVNEGGNALFIAAATSAYQIEWRVVTADGSSCWRDKDEITAKFTGVRYSAYKDGAGRDCLYLENIPLSMNGYYIQAKYWSDIDHSVTALTADKACRLTVYEVPLAAPTISLQPAGQDAMVGTPCTLSVQASAPEGAVSYQWYRNSTPSLENAVMLAGACNSSYTPEQTPGTTYYFCSLWASTNTKKSDIVWTAAAAVNYTAPTPVPVTPEPTATPDTAPVVVTVAPTDTPAPATPTPAPVPTTTGNSSNIIIIAIAAVLAVALICGTILVLKLNRRDR